MAEVLIFEGAMCCPTGVCDTDPEQTLVDLSADIHWALKQGASIGRFNLANAPQEFVNNSVVQNFIQIAGVDGLPLVLADGVTVMAGRYPTRSEIARFAGIGLAVSSSNTAEGGCCSPSEASVEGCCAGDNS